jgi:hypothetical protein
MSKKDRVHFDLRLVRNRFAPFLEIAVRQDDGRRVVEHLGVNILINVFAEKMDKKH